MKIPAYIASLYNRIKSDFLKGCLDLLDKGQGVSWARKTMVEISCDGIYPVCSILSLASLTLLNDISRPLLRTKNKINTSYADKGQGTACVEDIYEEIKQDFPTMSLATIYRNIVLIKSLGEVLELGFPDGSNRHD